MTLEEAEAKLEEARAACDVARAQVKEFTRIRDELQAQVRAQEIASSLTPTEKIAISSILSTSEVGTPGV